MTAPTPSSPDPDDHARRSSRPHHGRGGRHGGGQPGSHRRGDPAGGERPASPYGPYGSPGASGASGASGPAPDVPGAYGYHGAYAAHDVHGPALPEHPDTDARPDVRREVRDGALCALVVLVLGVGLGLLWLWLAPRVPLVSVDGGVFLKDPEGEEAVGADGTFVLLALVFGVVTGVLAFLCSRAGGVGLVVGLAVGALLGSVLAWQLGVWLGPGSDLAASAKAAGENKTFDGPLKLQAKGALLVWPFLALTTHLSLMSVFGRRDPEPAPPPGDDGSAQPW